MVLDTVFVLAAVAFFKERFGLFGWRAIVAALVASLVVVFLPDALALFPAAVPYVDKLVLVVKLFLVAPGLFDLAVDLGNKLQS